ncbi:MAG: caspase family protein [Deltaproteobacteria bacterium]|nr:MAG: caspase family protein [Deltaproteobacteria bacterium]
MPKGFSLHIGLNEVDPSHYAGWSGELVACEADAEDMQQIARTGRYESKLLKTSQASRDAVKSAIADAAAGLKSGDVFFLTCSSHGGQIPDLNGDEIDGLDETWVLYDGQLIDDELHELWRKFEKGVRVLVLSDSCHSGTVTKQIANAAALRGMKDELALSYQGIEEPKRRFMPAKVAQQVFRTNRAFYEAISKALPEREPLNEEKDQPEASVLLLSGCQDSQYSADGPFNGLFTGTLLQVWNQGTFEGGYRRFHESIVSRMPPTQTPQLTFVGEPDGKFLREKPFTI